jgi:uncharacterized protein Veg
VCKYNLNIEVILLIAKTDVSNCRDTLSNHIGDRIYLRSNGGRRRTVVHEGYLESCSPNVFTVRCPVSTNYDEHVCFSYVDVLTGVVEIALNADELDEILEEDE